MPRSGNHQRGGTLALRIQFKEYHGQKVSRTSQDDIQSLVPWLKAILSSLHLPHPKPTNVMKSNDSNNANVIEMFWDHAESTDVRAHVLHPPFCSDSRRTTVKALEKNMVNRLRRTDSSILQQTSM